MKACIFHGPRHHREKMYAVEKELIGRGVHVTRFTANAEASFECNLNEDYTPSGYLWLPDFSDREKSERLYDSAVPYFQRIYAVPSAVSLELPVITDRIMREICCDWTATKRLLSLEKPDVCLALHEINRWGCILGFWSSVYRIPYYTFQEGMYYGDPFVYTNHCRYSKSFVWGEATKRKLVAAGNDSQRIFVVGHPDIADKAEKARQDWQEVQKKLPASAKGKKLIFYFVSPVVVGNPDMKAIMDGMDSGEFFIVVHSHHFASKEHLNRMEEIFLPYVDKGYAYINKDFNDMWPFMVASDVVFITGCSTTGLEASYLQKPLVELLIPYQPFQFRTLGVALAGETIPIAQAATLALAEWQKEEVLSRVAAFVADEIAHDHAAPRIVDMIMSRV